MPRHQQKEESTLPLIRSTPKSHQISPIRVSGFNRRNNSVVVPVYNNQFKREHPYIRQQAKRTREQQNHSSVTARKQSPSKPINSRNVMEANLRS